jgi:DNA repair exonuclease SbcCD ATPase subunit
MKDSPIDLMVAAQKFGTLKEIEDTLADRQRLVKAANLDLADARVVTAKLKAEASEIVKNRRDEAEQIIRKLTADRMAAEETHRGVLRKMQDDAGAAIAALDATLENRRQLVADVTKELETWKDELGKIKSVFHDAKTVLGL